jgi:octaprenyl-diphosphate synthase
VLLGDYLLSRGLSVALQEDQLALLKITSRAVERMSEGELRQLKTTKLQTMTQDRYYQIIEEKTASLLAACMESGAVSVLDKPTEESLAQIHEAGIQIGLAFQIKDDLLDYQDKGIGKTKQHDIEERKVTLPLLKATSNASPSEAKQVMRRFKRRRKTKNDIQWILQFVEEHQGIKESEKAMIQHVERAMSSLKNHPDRRKDREATETLQQFEHLIDFVIHRSV